MNTIKCGKYIVIIVMINITVWIKKLINNIEPE